LFLLELFAQAIRIDVPEVVNFAVDEQHGDLFSVFGTKKLVFINRNFSHRHRRKVGEYTGNDNAGVLAEVAAVAANQGKRGHDFSLRNASPNACEKRPPCGGRFRRFLKKYLLLVATLVASLTKQLAVLLLCHTLAALLNY
jgi:hypothetical protein